MHDDVATYDGSHDPVEHHAAGCCDPSVDYGSGQSSGGYADPGTGLVDDTGGGAPIDVGSELPQSTLPAPDPGLPSNPTSDPTVYAPSAPVDLDPNHNPVQAPLDSSVAQPPAAIDTDPTHNPVGAPLDSSVAQPMVWDAGASAAPPTQTIIYNGTMTPELSAALDGSAPADQGVGGYTAFVGGTTPSGAPIADAPTAGDSSGYTVNVGGGPTYDWTANNPGPSLATLGNLAISMGNPGALAAVENAQLHQSGAVDAALGITDYYGYLPSDGSGL